MQGIPLIASPPVKHEPPINYQGYEVTKYQPPWKIFSEFAMQNDSENDTRTSTPAFQHLVNQVELNINLRKLLFTNFLCIHIAPRI
jgi:insulin gene enhancer protein ISL-1